MLRSSVIRGPILSSLRLNPLTGHILLSETSTSSMPSLTSEPISTFNLALQLNGGRLLEGLCRVVAQMESQSNWWSSRPQASSNRGDIWTVARALNEDSSCWEFSGDKGELGIRLARLASITHFDIQHHSASTQASHAPRDVVVWGIVDGRAQLERLEQSPQLRHTLMARVTSALDGPQFSPYVFLPLASFTFEPGATNVRREYYVLEEVTALALDYGIIVFQIKSNWGASSTQLCHVGVYDKLVCR